MKSQITRPMLADSIDNTNILQYPVIGSPKIDGIRCLLVNGQAVSRKFKPIPNHHIRETLESIIPEGADGEIIAGCTFQDVSSAVMSHDGVPAFTYCMFDLVVRDLERPYQERLKDIDRWWRSNDHAHSIVRVVPTLVLQNEEQLLEFESRCLKEGYEGIMVRTPDGPYKCGRATLKQGWLLKLKRFHDSEAEIIGFEEQMHNENEKQVNELGLTKRSTAKAGKRPANTLGKFLVRDLKSGVEFEIGTGEGLTQELRKEIWAHQKQYLSRLIKYKSQPTGVKDKPRFPIFLGFRDPNDMGE